MTTPAVTTRPSARGMTVRARILIAILLVTAAGMAAAGTTAFLFQREQTLSDVDTSLAAAADEASFIATDSAGATLDAVLGAIIQRYRPGTNQSTLGIVDGAAALTPGGDVAFRLEEDPVLIDRLVSEVADDQVVRGTATSAGRTLRYVAVPVTVTGDPRRGVFVTAVDLGAQLEPVTAAFRTFAVVALISLVAVALVGWLVAGRLLRPLRALREAASRITASGVAERIPVAGHDDVSELTYTVNGMLDRLDGAIGAQRRLLDDVGHELKTPITIVRGHLELMDAADPGDVAATRELAIDELDRMSSLVRDISALAELDHAVVLHLEPVEVASLTERIRSKASALSTSHEWAARETADVVAQLDVERITQAMLQLAANAVRHGAVDGVIELGSSVTRRSDGGQRLSLWVHNDGPAISAEAQRHIFERFRRGADASDRGRDGAGLGLAIVAAIVAAHGGTVGVTSAPGRGVRFTIELPVEAAVPRGVQVRSDVRVTEERA